MIDDAGLEVLNEDGTSALINSQYMNFTYSYKVRLVRDSANQLTMVQINANNPTLVTGESSRGALEVSRQKVSEGVWLIKMLVGFQWNDWVDLYVFDNADYKPTYSTWGLQVWNSDGKLVFDDKLNFLKVLGQYFWTPQEHSGQGYVYTPVFNDPKVKKLGALPLLGGRYALRGIRGHGNPPQGSIEQYHMVAVGAEQPTATAGGRGFATWCYVGDTNGQPSSNYWRPDMQRGSALLLIDLTKCN